MRNRRMTEVEIKALNKLYEAAQALDATGWLWANNSKCFPKYKAAMNAIEDLKDCIKDDLL